MEKHDLSTPHGRLRWARQRAGYEIAADAARRLGVKEVTYRAHEDGRGTIRALPDYYKVFRVSLEWLINGKGSPDDFIDDQERKVISFMRNMPMRDRNELEAIAKMKAKKDEAG